jgi:hypothetical protein
MFPYSGEANIYLQSPLETSNFCHWNLTEVTEISSS